MHNGMKMKVFSSDVLAMRVLTNAVPLQNTSARTGGGCYTMAVTCKFPPQVSGLRPSHSHHLLPVPEGLIGQKMLKSLSEFTSNNCHLTQ